MILFQQIYIYIFSKKVKLTMTNILNEIRRVISMING